MAVKEVRMNYEKNLGLGYSIVLISQPGQSQFINTRTVSQPTNRNRIKHMSKSKMHKSLGVIPLDRIRRNCSACQFPLLCHFDLQCVRDQKLSASRIKFYFTI